MSAAEQIRIPQAELRNVAFAMDFSPGSLLAFPFAADIAAHYGGTVFAIHVVPTEDYNAIPLAWQPGACQAVAEMQGSLVSPLGSLRNIPHELLLDHGSVCSGLLSGADRCDSDLIVIGTHGRQGLRKLLKGSIAEELAQRTSRPILMVGPKATRRSHFRHILCVTDYSACGMRTLPYAFSLAKSFETTVTLLHLKDCTEGAEFELAANYALSLKDVRNDRRLEYPGVAEFRAYLLRSGYQATAETTEVIIRYASAVCSLILRYAEDADLIVMRLPKKGDLLAKINAHLPGRSISYLISRAYCPILTIPV